MHLPTLTLALYAFAATASPTSPLKTRQGTTSLGSLTCGTTSYTKKQVDDAVAEGCRLYASREQLGTSKYPHQFNNREALVFAASGPYQEFPILEGGRIYSGRAPGPDRVVFSPSYKGDCVYVGAMTHTDAGGGNGFVSCNEKLSSSPGGNGNSQTTTTTISTKTTSSATQTATTAAATSSNAASGGLAGMGVQGMMAGVLAGLLFV
ncbi:hypothetical protein N0V88_005993 [Collariella sp. IMI 366227]|nr:hypothetical protein N0V88_005993 [Collariella sp. IMI 366227]